MVSGGANNENGLRFLRSTSDCDSVAATLSGVSAAGVAVFETACGSTLGLGLEATSTGAGFGFCTSICGAAAGGSASVGSPVRF